MLAIYALTNKIRTSIIAEDFIIAHRLGFSQVLPSSSTRKICNRQSFFFHFQIKLDADDCTVYHYCSDENAKVESFKCPEDFVFHSKTRLCRKLTSSKQCMRINCKNSLYKWVPYEPQKGYYAFCGKPFATMFKCPDEENYVFDTTYNKCVYKCESCGYFGDRLDCRTYHVCEKHGRVETAKCPLNYYFDKVKKKCVRGTCWPEIDTDDMKMINSL